MRPLFRHISSFCLIILMGASKGYCYSSSANTCAAQIVHHEKQYGIPSGLLDAVSKVESGRKVQGGHIIAWPWTINVEGAGYYFPTKEAAITAVRLMQSKGITSIDVGCMQINLHHHPSAFKTLEDAFDPVQNVAYAALFLTRLKKEHFSWKKAVAHYHSANPVHHKPYQQNVYAQWNQEKRGGSVRLAAGILPSPLMYSDHRRVLPISQTVDANLSSQSGVRKVTRCMLLQLKR